MTRQVRFTETPISVHLVPRKAKLSPAGFPEFELSELTFFVSDGEGYNPGPEFTQFWEPEFWLSYANLDMSRKLVDIERLNELDEIKEYFMPLIDQWRREREEAARVLVLRRRCEAIRVYSQIAPASDRIYRKVRTGFPSDFPFLDWSLLAEFRYGDETTISLERLREIAEIFKTDYCPRLGVEY